MEVNVTTGNYPPPYSLSPIPTDIRKGLLVIGTLACISLIATATVLVFITCNFVSGRGHNKHAAAHNQCIILVFNLLLADFQQALSFAISFHWYIVDGINAPSDFCVAQGSLLNFADLASGMFVVSIAMHTAYSVFTRKRYVFKWFVASIVAQWTAAFVLTVSGPLHFGKDFFTRAGNWCWISQLHSTERLWLHYLWIFIFEFVSILIYVVLALYIWRGSRLSRSQGSSSSGSRDIIKAARRMIYFPLVYIIGTLPIAIGRMMAMSGKDPPARFLLGAGALLTSFGWLDALLYTITRKVLTNIDNDQRQSVSSARILSSDSSFPLHRSSKTTSIRNDSLVDDMHASTPAVSSWPRRQPGLTTPSWGSRTSTVAHDLDLKPYKTNSSESPGSDSAWLPRPAMYLDWSPPATSPTSSAPPRHQLDGLAHE